MRRGTWNRWTDVRVIAAMALCLTAGALAVATSAPAASPHSPSTGAARADVVHRSQYWSWTGPANWTASYGVYGITVQGPKSGFDEGFATILCVPAPSRAAAAQKFFAGQRRVLAKDARILGMTRIKHVPSLGPTYFRQAVNISNRINGKSYLGQVVYDYDAAGPQYCYQRSISFGALRRGFAASMKQLLRVFGTVAYFGPGAYEDFSRSVPH